VGELHVDASIIEFATVMSAATTILAAVAPAWGGTRENAAPAFVRTASGATAARSAVRWRHALIGIQASLTTMLLIFSALLLTSLWRLGRVPLGFEPRCVIAVNVQLLDTKYDAAAITTLQDELLRRVRQIPGVTSAGLTSAIPFRGFDSPADVQVVGSDRTMRVRVRYVDSAFFGTLHVPILRGRLFSIGDRSASTAVAVVPEAFAHSAFGAVDPVGKRLSLDRPTEIVGVVGNMRYNGLDRQASPAVYVPMSQYPRPLSTLVVRMHRESASAPVIDEIRRALHDIDPALAAVNVATIDQVVDATIAGRRFYSVASGRCACSRRAPARARDTVGVGCYRTQARSSCRRRCAAGDREWCLVWSATRALGSALIAQFLFQITPRSPSTYAGAALVVIGAASAAAWLPMRRFARLSLSQLLRED
jgi:hypothetical protein